MKRLPQWGRVGVPPTTGTAARVRAMQEVPVSFCSWPRAAHHGREGGAFPLQTVKANGACAGGEAELCPQGCVEKAPGLSDWQRNWLCEWGSVRDERLTKRSPSVTCLALSRGNAVHKLWKVINCSERSCALLIAVCSLPCALKE